MSIAQPVVAAVSVDSANGSRRGSQDERDTGPQHWSWCRCGGAYPCPRRFEERLPLDALRAVPGLSNRQRQQLVDQHEHVLIEGLSLL